MQTTKRTWFDHLFNLTILGLICLLTGSNAANANNKYEVVDIPPPDGYTRSKCHGINNNGQVAGRYYNYTTEAIDKQAFVWDCTNGMIPLPTLSGESSAWAINESGLVSGDSYNASGYQRAVRWDTTNATIIDLGALTNPNTQVEGDSSSGYGINDAGHVVGLADIPNDSGSFTPFHGFVYDGSIHDLGTLTTSWPEWANGYSIAYSINNSEEIVGIAHDTGWAFRPFIYNESTGGMQALLTDPAYSSGEWYAVVINDTGLIGGHVISATDQSLPYYWPDSTSPAAAITMPVDYPYGEIYSINESNQMVGIMWDPNETDHAFIFDSVDGIRDLNDLIDPESGWELNYARDINDKGHIVGFGSHTGEMHGFILICDADGQDLAVLANAFGSIQGDPDYDPAADLDSSNNVDEADLALFADNFGDKTSCI